MKSLKITSLFTISLTAAFIIFMGVMVASGAWTEPTNAPPLGNVSAPINVGNDGQAKIGGLVVNTGGAINGLGVLGGGSLDLSGIIRIVDENGNLAPGGEGKDNQVLTRTDAGMAWQTTPYLPECELKAMTGVSSQQTKIDFDVPDQCLDKTCNLILAVRNNSQQVVELKATSYFQFTKKAIGSESDNILNWWIKAAASADGVTEGCLRGKNGTGQGCDRILKHGENGAIRLVDDATGFGTDDNDPKKWTLIDENGELGAELLLCD
jgi:hypothetical protein